MCDRKWLQPKVVGGLIIIFQVQCVSAETINCDESIIELIISYFSYQLTINWTKKNE